MDKVEQRAGVRDTNKFRKYNEKFVSHSLHCTDVKSALSSRVVSRAHEKSDYFIKTEITDCSPFAINRPTNCEPFLKRRVARKSPPRSPTRPRSKPERSPPSPTAP